MYQGSTYIVLQMWVSHTV